MFKGSGKREAHKSWSMVIPEKAAPVYSNYLEDYWPCASGLSAVNAIGTQLQDLINSGLTRWRFKLINGRRRGKREEFRELSTRSSLGVENEQADAGRDGRICLAKPSSQARTGAGKKSFSLFS